MARGLHVAIRDAVRLGDYEKRGILVDQALHATLPTAGNEEELGLAVRALFIALPQRLVSGSLLLISTQDVEDGLELAWDSREEPRRGYAIGDGLLGPYDPGEPLAIALANLANYCDLRAGYVRTSFEEVSNSSSFQRAPYLRRRIVARLPLDPAFAVARDREAHVVTTLPHVAAVAATPTQTTDRKLGWRRMPAGAPVPSIRSAARRIR